MIIKVNDKSQEISGNEISVSDLLVKNKVEMPDMVSVQLNGEFIDKSQHAATVIKDNDQVDFLYFMGGGENSNDLGFNTKAIHSKSSKEDPYGTLRMPVYDSVAFEFKTSEDIEAAFLGRKPAHMYTRITNPTVENFELVIKNVTNSLGVVAVSSGMAAISNLVLAIMQSGENIITTKHLFGNTYSLFTKTLKPWGLEIKCTDLTDYKSIEKLVDKKTKAVFFETITNPQIEVADIKALSEIAKRNKIILIADTTLTPLCFFNSKEYGVDIEILSSTKYLSGGATSVGGLIIDNGIYGWKNIERLNEDVKKYGPFALISKLKREVYRDLGSCLSPHAAYLQCLGIETLELRADKSCENTLKIAEFLEKHKKVKRVSYPGLKGSKYYELAKKQFNGRFGALLTFDLNTKEECFKFMDNLKIIKRATNLNDNKTLVIHPNSTIFCEYTPEEREEMSVRNTMLRLAVGIEDVNDLIRDINEALEAL